MDILIPAIITWAEDRNLIRGISIETLALHLTSEFGQLSEAIINGSDCRKYIGNSFVELIMLCHKENFTLHECIDLVGTIDDERLQDPIFTLLVMSKHVGQLAADILRKRNIKLDIGYILTYLTILSKNMNSTMKDCLSISFNHLKEMKGIMFDGRYILETDEYYNRAIRIIKNRKNYWR